MVASHVSPTDEVVVRSRGTLLIYVYKAYTLAVARHVATDLAS